MQSGVWRTYALEKASGYVQKGPHEAVHTLLQPGLKLCNQPPLLCVHRRNKAPGQLLPQPPLYGPGSSFPLQRNIIYKVA